MGIFKKISKLFIKNSPFLYFSEKGAVLIFLHEMLTDISSVLLLYQVLPTEDLSRCVRSVRMLLSVCR